MNLYDVIIIGGGPAGLNAAVVLGRCRRKVLLFDTGNPRNRSSSGIHNYLTRDGILPRDFIHSSNKEAKKYGVIIRNAEVVTAEKTINGAFRVRDNTETLFYAKKLLVATGLTDRVPLIEGVDDFYGKSVFHCPYCDGWEVRDKRIGIYARNKNGFELALALTTWSKTVTLFTDGRQYLKPEEAMTLSHYRIPVITQRIQKLQGRNGKLKSLLLADQKEYPCDAIFFVNGYIPQSSLVEKLGCELTKKKAVITNRYQQTNIKGVYVAGDAARDMHFVVVAAAEGARAGVTINRELQKEEKTLAVKR